MFASCASASAAPLAPSSRITSRRARRERTSAYSAITKNALIAISSAVRVSVRPFTPAGQSVGRADARRVGAVQDDAGVRGPSGPSYFGEVLRRRSSLADLPNLARASVGRGTIAAQDQTTASIWPARAKSASVRPPCECVESVRRTLFQP